MASQFDIRSYVPPGPVASAFILNDARQPTIMGPVGSGKTHACIARRLKAGLMQPIGRDGWIRDRWLVVRDDYRTLEKTTLKSWHEWFPKTYPGGEFSGGNDRPATHILRFDLGKGVRAELQTEFTGVSADSFEEKLRGAEYSGGWMNEQDLLTREVRDMMDQRLGRYPSKMSLPDGARVYSQLIGDLNAPAVGSWVHEDYWEKPIAGHRVMHRQPSAMARDAENIHNLPGGYAYYENMMVGKPDWWLRRFITNEFGYSREGQPVYAEFSEVKHVARSPLTPAKGLPIYIGLDGGLHPAAIIIQPLPNGQVRVLDELVPGPGVGPARFADMLLDLLLRRYREISTWEIYADPATQYGADREGGEQSWLDIMSRALDTPIRLPNNGSNELAPRIEAVRLSLVHDIDGYTPSIVISPHCRKLIQGFASHYRFRKVKVGLEMRTEDKPEKNDWSHPHDALQYVMQGYRGATAIIAEASRGHRASFGIKERGDASVGWRAKASFNVHQLGRR